METKVESLRSNDKGWNGEALEYSPLQKVGIKSDTFYIVLKQSVFSNLGRNFRKK